MYYSDDFAWLIFYGLIFFVIYLWIKYSSKKVRCEVCGEMTSGRYRCAHCSSILDTVKHERLHYIKKVRNELFEFKAKGIISQDVLNILDKEYNREFQAILDELKEVSKPKVEPVVIEKEEPKRIEVPVQKVVVEKEEMVEKAEKRISTVRWSERVIKSLLYVGVLGLIGTVSIILYNYRHGIPDLVKFSILFLITCGIFYGGYLLRYKFDYTRTGLALLVLSSLLLPMNYLSAKIFRLIPAGNTYMEWVGVSLFCAVLYMVLAVLIKEEIFAYMGVVTGFVCFDLLLWSLRLDIIGQCKILVLFSLMYLIIGRIFYKKPFSYVGWGIAGLVLAVFLFHIDNLTSVGVFSLEFAILFITASLLYKLPKILYPANIALIISGVSLMPYTPALEIYLISCILACVGYIFYLLDKKDFATPFYFSSYGLSFFGLFFLGVGFLFDSRYILLGFIISSIYYWVCTYYSKKEVNTYLAIITSLGLVVEYIGIFPYISIIVLAIGILMCVLSRLQIPKYIATPLYIFSHLLIPVVAIGFNLYYFAIDKFGYLSCITLAIAAAYYVYNALVSKDKRFSYITVMILYSVFFSYLILVKGLIFEQTLPLLSFLALLGSIAGLGLWRVSRDLWSWPILNISLVISLGIVGMSILYLIDYNVSLTRIKYIYLFSGITTLIYGIAKTLVKDNLMGVYTFIGGLLLNSAYTIFLRMNGTPWGLIGIYLMMPSSVYLGISYICKKTNYPNHSLALWGLITVTCGTALILSGIFNIQVFLWTSLISSIIFAITYFIAKIDLFIYFSIISALLCFLSLLEILGIYEWFRGIYVLGFAIALFILGRFSRKNPFYTIGFFLTVAVPLYYLFTDIDWYSHYINTAIFMFIIISIIYGVMSVVLKRMSLVYLSAIVFGIAYAMTLQKFDVPLFNYGIWFLTLAFAIIGIGRLGLPQASRLGQNPFYIIGLGITLLVLLSMVAWGEIYIREQINIAIISALICAVFYGLLSYFLRDKKIFYLSLLMLLSSYYLVLWKYRINVTEFYTVFPASICIGLGMRERIKKISAVSVTPLTKINIGLGIYFLPGLYQTFYPAAILEGAIVGLSALALVLIALRFRVKHVFVSGLSILVFDILLQAFHFINFGAIPKVFWIGLASVTCIFIGFLGEKRFKEFIKSGLRKTKKSISDYFSDWR